MPSNILDVGIWVLPPRIQAAHSSSCAAFPTKKNSNKKSSDKKNFNEKNLLLHKGFCWGKIGWKVP